MMDFNEQFEAAKRLAEILKMHNEFRSVQHVGTVVCYAWNQKKYRISFSRDERTK